MTVVAHKTRKPMMKAAVLAMGIALPGLVAAEAGISVAAPGATIADVTADVNLRVIVPQILAMRVGDFGSTVNNIEWTFAESTGTHSVTTSNADWAGPSPLTFTQDITLDDSTDGTDGDLLFYVFGNNGDITIESSSSTGGATLDDVTAGSSRTIPLTDITVTDSNSTHPSALHSGSATITANAAGVATDSDTWTYDYSPTATPGSGDYQTTITYTASMP